MKIEIKTLNSITIDGKFFNSLAKAHAVGGEELSNAILVYEGELLKKVFDSEARAANAEKSTTDFKKERDLAREESKTAKEDARVARLPERQRQAAEMEKKAKEMLDHAAKLKAE